MGLSTTDYYIGDSFGVIDLAQDFNADINNIFDVEVAIGVDNIFYGPSFTIACCRLEPVSQRTVARYYQRYLLPRELTPTDALCATLNDRDRAFLGVTC